MRKPKEEEMGLDPGIKEKWLAELRVEKERLEKYLRGDVEGGVRRKYLEYWKKWVESRAQVIYLQGEGDKEIERLTSGNRLRFLESFMDYIDRAR